MKNMESASSFIGYYVSLSCDNDSIYEGEVGDIDAARQLITLTHAHQLFPDGNTLKFPQITLTGNHIKNLKIVRERIVMPALDVLKLETASMNGSKSRNSSHLEEKVSPKVHNDYQTSPTKRKPNGCFSDNANDIASYPDFDFQGNLAKFDKEAVYEELMQNSNMATSSVNIPEHDRKMKVQENVLESKPVSLRQIKVPVAHAGKEYSTEDGIIIPSITLSLKAQLFACAEKAGLSRMQIAENAGVCTCQMVLQLLGGSLRINPKNNHQRPEVVVLAGCHTQGLQAICMSRHLANHTVKVLLFLADESSSMQGEINLFIKAGGKVIKSHQELPAQPVDMIIDAMIGLESQRSPNCMPFIVSWANKNKAPLLSIDPCIPQLQTDTPDIKWGIAMGLPLIKSPKVGRLYLADLGIPRGVFKDVGIEYESPFKDKFYIPLY